MRVNPYDDTVASSSTVSSVAIQSLTGSSAVNGDVIDTETLVVGGLESAMLKVRAEIAAGSPSAATVTAKIQEGAKSDGSDMADALDNTGVVIGTGALNVHVAAAEAFARIEGIGLNRKRYLRVVLTPAFTGGSSPSIATFAEVIATPRSAFPVRTATSNT